MKQRFRDQVTKAIENQNLKSQSLRARATNFDSGALFN